MVAGASQAAHKGEKSGLAYWMRRVVAERARLRRELSPDGVHDLRVALRRCRSMADAVMELDPHTSWKDMRKAGRKLFRALGELRDTQVLQRWLAELAPEDDPVRQRMQELLAAREQQARRKAQAALERFDRKKWLRLVPECSQRMTRDTLVFEHIALERWQEAYDLHRRALRNRRPTAFHRLRIGIKRFRYVVENFLPERHAEWGAGLKRVQDLLGEVHDLDVLWLALREAREVFDPAARQCWRQRIDEERGKRLAEYRAKMTRKIALWKVWRAGLPDGEQLERSAWKKLEAWAAFRDPDIRQSERIAELAEELFDGLAASGVHEIFRDARARRILRTAALLHNVGLAQGKRGHHKTAYRLIRDFPPPAGWHADEMLLAALVARYHRGAEPRDTHEGINALLPKDREKLLWLAGVLRLAGALGSQPGATFVGILDSTQAIQVLVRSYPDTAGSAGHLAARKHLLEAASGRPIIILPKPAAAARRARG